MSKPTEIEVQAARQRWIEALRSGAYPQATGALKTAAGYCCLGVLCDLVRPADWVPDGRQFAIPKDEDEIEDDEDSPLASEYPPGSVLDAVGLDQFDAEYLAQKNDVGASFATIADIIENGRFFNTDDDAEDDE